jgi:hypothetical protein
MWNWIKLNLFQGLGATQGNVLGVVSGSAASVIRYENPDLPPTIGEMANQAAVSAGEVIYKIFTPIKWILFGVSAVLLLWAFLGRKS